MSAQAATQAAPRKPTARAIIKMLTERRDTARAETSRAARVYCAIVAESGAASELARQRYADLDIACDAEIALDSMLTAATGA